MCASPPEIKIIIDSYHDFRTGYEFAVNPADVKCDYAVYGEINEDPSWDGVWEAAATVDSLGWTAEFRIPLSQLRYADAKEHTFGFGIWRDIDRFKERDRWPVYKQSDARFMSQLGTVEKIDGIPSPHSWPETSESAPRNVSRWAKGLDPSGVAPIAHPSRSSAAQCDSGCHGRRGVLLARRAGGAHLGKGKWWSGRRRSCLTGLVADQGIMT